MTVTLTIGSGKNHSTIQAAWNALPSTLSEPYILEIYAGTYAETLSFSGKTTTETNNITVTRATGENVVLNLSGEFAVGSSNITIIDLPDITTANTAHYWTGSKIVIDKCKFYMPSGGYIAIRGEFAVQNTLIDSDGGEPLRRQTSATIKLYNNTLLGSGAVWGSTTAGGTIISRNNIIWCKDTGTTSIIYIVGATTYTASNNIYYKPDGSEGQFNISGTTYYVSNYFSSGKESSSSYGDPTFVNFSSRDYRLNTGSACINSGYNTGINYDLLGLSRPVGSAYDIGAYEYSLGVAASPTFNPGTGTYTSSQSVTLSSQTSGATIYYTTDGSTPTHSSSVYSVAISVGQTMTIKALAYKDNYSDSTISSSVYTLQVVTPVITLASGNYEGVQETTITCSTPSVSIYYTLDGSTPDDTKTLYTGTITLNQGGTYTLKAIAIKDNWNNSNIASATYSQHLLFNFFRIGTKDEINFFKGYMDEIRVSKGKARWTTDFTPPNTYYS